MKSPEICARWNDFQNLLQGGAASLSDQLLSEHLETCESCSNTLANLIQADRLSTILRFSDENPKTRTIPPDLIGQLSTLDRPPRPVEPTPEMIGRYRVKSLLGRGGYGLVYLAYDDQLDRHVAIKVPHQHLVSNPELADSYRKEAQTVAGLDHPHIVPVHDVGSTSAYPCFIVLKYINGRTIAQKLTDGRPTWTETAQLVATIAEALHHAHSLGFVHRDIKPGNILLDSRNEPYVADFGIALRTENLGTGSKFTGTPGYMSPEQARGEVHRVDHRSDIFSLGVVFFELLVGHVPFSFKLGDQKEKPEIPRPRQFDGRIPDELERICLRALSKRAVDRYATAHEMAAELKAFIASEENPDSSVSRARIVPKGLRSFDAHDAGFYLDLLPGPHSREGLPESIRFWKTRIEDSAAAFPICLIYGPSGCGKSSFIKAGLLPRLSKAVAAVYIEATANETENHLLSQIRKRYPGIPGEFTLVESLAYLRKSTGQKVLIVLDQFEQWLYAGKKLEEAKLVRALRQCDGDRLQAIVMVRDDFWMGITRFLRELEVRQSEGENSTAIDLFDPDHAQFVLAAFGRAYGKLPDNPSETTQEQKQFLLRVVQGLSQDGKVICVRLALFAEMFAGKPWTLESLKRVGGIDGLGYTFLEEAFGAITAPAKNRFHRRAVEGILKTLLPESTTDIKGHRRSTNELIVASGYQDRPSDFQELVQILDRDLRLMTPIDPEVQSTDEAQATSYQLSHDYLVPSIRDWLTRKQKETRRGRAELLLEDRSKDWIQRNDKRQLPTGFQLLQIRTFTSPKRWNDDERRMLAVATRRHLLRTSVALIFLVLLGIGFREGYGNLKAHGLRDRLLAANTEEVPAIVNEMNSYRRWLDPLLKVSQVQAQADKEQRKQLHVSLALLPMDASQADYLNERLLEAEPNEIPVIRTALAPHQHRFLEQWW